MKHPSLRSPSILALAVFAMLTLSAVSHAESESPTAAPPDTEQPDAGRTIAVPPALKPVECNDDNELYKPCDKKFKLSCKRQKGEFYCDNPERTEGTCHLPDA